jgi:hypothetical protein
MEYVQITKTQATQIANTVFLDKHVLIPVLYNSKWYVQASAIGYYAYESIQSMLIGKPIIEIEVTDEDT